MDINLISKALEETAVKELKTKILDAERTYHKVAGLTFNSCIYIEINGVNTKFRSQELLKMITKKAIEDCTKDAKATALRVFLKKFEMISSEFANIRQAIEDHE